jgi:hypothetical protein
MGGRSSSTAVLRWAISVRGVCHSGDRPVPSNIAGGRSPSRLQTLTYDPAPFSPFHPKVQRLPVEVLLTFW